MTPAIWISLAGLIGAAIGWLLVDAREKTRAEIYGKQVELLVAEGKAVREALATQKERLDNVDRNLGRLDRDKADRVILEGIMAGLGRIDAHLNKIDDKIDAIRDRA